ncbi:MAG: xylulose kinase [Candidatus Ancillula sp.]|jgi:xylulokinase|nr:xylulose kinase [Candidatus Ancillula sp.]
MSNNVLVAGVDTSTQSCKVVVRELESGKLVRSGSAAHPDGTECHPDHWWNAFKDAASCAGGLDDVAAISVGGQQHGMVLLDEDGEVIRPALLWNDTRSAVAAEDLIAEFGARSIEKSPAAAYDGRHISEIGAKAWADAIGSVLVASITVTKIRWVAATEPENAKRIRAICLPHDWLSWRLAGYGPKSQGLNPDLNAIFTDRSDASGTGYFDATAENGLGAYRRDLLDMALRPAGITSENIILPRVLQPTEHALTTTPANSAEKVIPEDVLIGPGGGDNAAAAFGLGLSTGEVSVSLGTSGVVAAISATPTADRTGAINGFADCTGNYLPLACTLNASRDIDAANAILGVSYEELSDLALKAEPGAGGITLVPYFEGERVPNRPTANASLFGLTLQNSTRENIARAFVEGMLLGQNDGLVQMQKMGVTIRKVYMIGGSMKSPAVREIAPAIFGRDITLPEIDEYVANGAARQAAWVYNAKNGKPDAPQWKLKSEEVITAPETQEVVDNYEAVKDLPTKGELLNK